MAAITFSARFWLSCENSRPTFGTLLLEAKPSLIESIRLPAATSGAHVSFPPRAKKPRRAVISGSWASLRMLVWDCQRLREELVRRGSVLDRHTAYAGCWHTPLAEPKAGGDLLQISALELNHWLVGTAMALPRTFKALVASHPANIFRHQARLDPAGWRTLEDIANPAGRGKARE